jgi:hypothetical protein
LIAMTASTTSGVSSVTDLRFGMPALLTSTSTPPSSSSARRANDSIPSRSDKSTVHDRDSGECLRRRSSTSRSLSSRRAQMPTVAPRSANPSASAAPIPDDAPVTNTFLPASE